MTDSLRADELKPGDRVSVDDSTILTVDETRPGHPGEVDIRWAGSPLWASTPAGREFDVVDVVDEEAA